MISAAEVNIAATQKALPGRYRGALSDVKYVNVCVSNRGPTIMATLLTLAIMPCNSPWLSAATWLDNMLFTDGAANPPNDDKPHQKNSAAKLPAVATPTREQWLP